MTPYRWWTVFGWHDHTGRGVKLGPLTVHQWVSTLGVRHRTWCLALFGWVVYDGFARAMRED